MVTPFIHHTTLPRIFTAGGGCLTMAFRVSVALLSSVGVSVFCFSRFSEDITSVILVGVILFCLSRVFEDIIIIVVSPVYTTLWL